MFHDQNQFNVRMGEDYDPTRLGGGQVEVDLTKSGAYNVFTSRIRRNNHSLLIDSTVPAVKTTATTMTTTSA